MLARIASFIGYVSDTPARTLTFSFGVAVVFGLLDAFADLITFHYGAADIHTAVQAIFIGVATGLASIVLLVARREHRRHAREELLRVAELNHRLRNALQVIRYANHLDACHSEMMVDAVNSIETALRQLFPAVAADKRRAMREPAEKVIPPRAS